MEMDLKQWKFRKRDRHELILGKCRFDCSSFLRFDLSFTAEASLQLFMVSSLRLVKHPRRQMYCCAELYSSVNWKNWTTRFVLLDSALLLHTLITSCYEFVKFDPPKKSTVL